METRDESQPAVYTTCVQCGQGTYNLVSEFFLHETVKEEPISAGTVGAVGLTDIPPTLMDNGATSE